MGFRDKFQYKKARHLCRGFSSCTFFHELFEYHFLIPQLQRKERVGERETAFIKSLPVALRPLRKNVSESILQM